MPELNLYPAFNQPIEREFYLLQAILITFWIMLLETDGESIWKAPES